MSSLSDPAIRAGWHSLFYTHTHTHTHAHTHTHTDRERERERERVLLSALGVRLMTDSVRDREERSCILRKRKWSREKT